MTRSHVLDTCVVLADPNSILRFDEHEVILPLVVIEELARMKILCMSGYLRESDVAEVLGQGVDDFIRKPMDLPDLLGRVYRLLGLA